MVSTQTIQSKYSKLISELQTGCIMWIKEGSLFSSKTQLPLNPLFWFYLSSIITCIERSSIVTNPIKISVKHFDNVAFSTSLIGLFENVRLDTGKPIITITVFFPINLEDPVISVLSTSWLHYRNCNRFRNPNDWVETWNLFLESMVRLFFTLRFIGMETSRFSFQRFPFSFLVL